MKLTRKLQTKYPTLFDATQNLGLRANSWEQLAQKIVAFHKEYNEESIRSFIESESGDVYKEYLIDFFGKCQKINQMIDDQTILPIVKYYVIMAGEFSFWTGKEWTPHLAEAKRYKTQKLAESTIERTVSNFAFSSINEPRSVKEIVKEIINENE